MKPRRSMFGLAIAALTGGLCLVAPTVGCAADDARLSRFPDPAWPVTADLAAAGTSPARIAGYDRWLKAHGDLYWASVVVKDGYLVYSGRGPRCTVDQKNDCGSILKPLQATVLGAALL